MTVSDWKTGKRFLKGREVSVRKRGAERHEGGKRLGVSLVARNSTGAFLEFPAAREGRAGDTNSARTFPWKRPPSLGRAA